MRVHTHESMQSDTQADTDVCMHTHDCAHTVGTHARVHMQTGKSINTHTLCHCVDVTITHILMHT